MGIYSAFLGILHPTSKSPRLLPVHVHGNSQQGNRNRDAANNEEAVPDPLNGDPVVAVKRQAERKHVFDKVHDGKRLGRFFPVAVGHVRHHARGSQLNPQVDEPHADDDGHRPGILVVQALPPREEARGRDEVGDHDGEAELGLEDAAVLPGHEPGDAVDRGARHGGADQGRDEGRDVGGADRSDREAVGRRREDLRERDGDEDQPGDARREEEGRPGDHGRAEEGEWEDKGPPEGRLVPVAIVREELPDEGFRGVLFGARAELNFVVLGVDLFVDHGRVEVGWNPAVIGRLGHEEDGEEKLHGECGAHGMECDSE